MNISVRVLRESLMKQLFLKRGPLRFQGAQSKANFVKLHYLQSRPMLYLASQVFVQPREISAVNALVSFRSYAKRKKGAIEQSEDDDEEEVEESVDEDLYIDEVDGSSIVTKTVPSLRLDTLLKGSLNSTKKKIEKQFYQSNIRLNGEPAVKKAYVVQIGDEIDLVIGYVPENEKLLQVHRVILKSVEKVSGTGSVTVKLQVFKSLVIENYENQWTPSNL